MSRLSQFFSDEAESPASFQPASPGMEPIATRHVRDDAYLIEMVVRAFGVDEESRQRRNSEDGPRRRLGSCSGGRRSSSAVGGGGEGGGGGGDYEGVRAAQQRLEGKIDEIYRMLRTQKTRDDA